MNEKQLILKEITPKAVLKALNTETIDAVPRSFLQAGMVGIRHFPFRVGRESRAKSVMGRLVRMERQKLHETEPNNDLYLIDRGEFLNISREHFSIEKKEGRYLLVDRGSACGTRIGDVVIGGDDAGGSHELKDGDIISVGGQWTVYKFQFITLDDVLPGTYLLE